MGASVSVVVDAAAFLTKDEAMALAGADQWDEAQWEAAEKDDQGRVKAELFLAAVEQAKRKAAEVVCGSASPRATPPPILADADNEGEKDMEPPPLLLRHSSLEQRHLDDELRLCCVSLPK